MEGELGEDGLPEVVWAEEEERGGGCGVVDGGEETVFGGDLVGLDGTLNHLKLFNRFLPRLLPIKTKADILLNPIFFLTNFFLKLDYFLLVLFNFFPMMF